MVHVRMYRTYKEIAMVVCSGVYLRGLKDPNFDLKKSVYFTHGCVVKHCIVRQLHKLMNNLWMMYVCIVRIRK